MVGTPYEDEINQRLKRHLEASGFEVLQIAGYGVRKNAQLTDLPVHASYKIAKRLHAKARDADGIFIPLPALADDRRPSATGRGDRQASDHQQPGCIWYAMKLIDIRENVSGYGRLMASLGV